MELIAELMRITVDLNEHGIDYAICGGVAMTIHGHARPSHNIDILIRKDDLALCKCILAGIGYTLEAGIISEESNSTNKRETYQISKVKMDQLLSVNFELLVRGLEEIWETRKVQTWRGITLPVISVPGLQLMAQMAGEDDNMKALDALANR